MTNIDLTKTGDEIAKRIGFTPKLVPIENWPSAEQKIFISDEVEEYGKFIVGKYRRDLLTTSICYAFKPKASRGIEGQAKGQVKIEDEYHKITGGFDAGVIIGFDEWSAMDVDNKLRMVMFEIEKIIFDDKTGRLKSREPEVCQFPSIMQVFGPSSSAEIEMISAYNKFVKDNGGLTP